MQIPPAIFAAMLTITAGAVAALLGVAWGIYRLTRRNNKLLEGFEDSDAYDGVVAQVQRHEDALDREGLLDADRTE
jgi:hypothetical protein